MESNISPAQSTQSLSPTDQIDTKYAAILSSSLNKFRTTEKYTDVEIVASNGQVFPAHRVIVATAGQRFGQLLEKAKKKPKSMGIVQLQLPQQVPSAGINRLLEYIYKKLQKKFWNFTGFVIFRYFITFFYTGKTYLEKETVQEVLQAANYYDIKSWA